MSTDLNETLTIINKGISIAIEDREKGLFEEALIFIDKALGLAMGAKLWPEVVNILCQRLLVHMHRFENTGSKEAKHLWEDDCNAAYQFAIDHELSGQPLALASSRFGQFLECTGDMIAACQMFDKAIKNIDTESLDYAYYLSSLGAANVMCTKGEATSEAREEGYSQMAEAEAIARSLPSDTHQQILLSGVLIRQAKARLWIHETGFRKQVNKFLTEAHKLAKQLEKKGFGQRINQVEVLKRELL